MDPEDDETVVWNITIIDKQLSNSSSKTRPVFGLLRASSENGWAEVEVSAGLVGSKKGTEESLKRDIVESGAAENLYDFARVHVQTLLAQVRSDQYIGLAAPEPQLRFISRQEFDKLAADKEA
ncbi:hypothetical protein [Microbacterium sp. K36]|uniref:hypothetical protein n=1 Tax=Microbacterium sp. K36 TaxID=2305439 RepID=UPI00109D0C9C|nr:hypothetical protein [Microbacterium sp. K36]